MKPIIISCRLYVVCLLRTLAILATITLANLLPAQHEPHSGFYKSIVTRGLDRTIFQITPNEPTVKSQQSFLSIKPPPVVVGTMKLERYTGDQHTMYTCSTLDNTSIGEAVFTGKYGTAAYLVCVDTGFRVSKKWYSDTVPNALLPQRIVCIDRSSGSTQVYGVGGADNNKDTGYEFYHSSLDSAWNMYFKFNNSSDTSLAEARKYPMHLQQPSMMSSNGNLFVADEENNNIVLYITDVAGRILHKNIVVHGQNSTDTSWYGVRRIVSDGRGGAYVICARRDVSYLYGRTSATTGDVIIFNIDAQGSVLWEQRYPNPDDKIFISGNDISRLDGENLVVLLKYTSQDKLLEKSGFMIIGNNGTIVSKTMIDEVDYADMTRLYVTPERRIIIVGQYAPLNQLRMIDAAQCRMMAYEIDTDLNSIRWLKVFQNDKNAESSFTGLAPYRTGEYIMAGIVAGVATLTAVKDEPDASSGVLEEMLVDASSFVWPNPCTQMLSICVPAALLGGRVDIYTIDGSCMNSLVAEPDTRTIDVSKLPVGEYLLAITSGTKVYRGRFTVIR